ncbi:MAG: hypothetical protein ABSE05_04610 [Syntrophales bacterium]|jgi:ABC-type branched-subunit amino acid transport system ATPase component
MRLTTSDRGYILENGRIMIEGPAQNLLEDEKGKECLSEVINVGATHESPLQQG